METNKFWISLKKPSSAETSSTNCKSKSPTSRDSNETKSLREFYQLYPNKRKTFHININSIRSKLDLLSNQFKGHLDLLMIFRIKIDEIFPAYQLGIDRFNINFGVDRNQKVGRTMLHIRDD